MATTPSTTAAPAVGTPYFMGDYALVKITGVNGFDPNIVWLADVKNKTVRPFANDQALAAFYNVPDVNQLANYITPITGDSFGPDGVMKGFQPLDASYAVQGNGTAKTYDTTPGAIQSRYGQAADDAAESRATGTIDAFLGLIQQKGSGISKDTFSKYTNDPATLASYISAMAYGGYSLGDVYADLARRQLVDSGNTSLANSTSISPIEPKSQYQYTSSYQAATSNPVAALPSSMNVNQSLLNSTLTQIPDDAFKELSQALTPEKFQQEKNKASSIIYEAQLQMINASSDQQRQMAQSQWETNKKSIEQSLGVSLSNDALQAWNQIEALNNNAEAGNLSGSGIQKQQIDDYLKQVRVTANAQRKSSQTQEENQDMLYYQNYASPTQVQQLIASDPNKAQQWGLIPDGSTKQFLSTENLTQMFPNATADDIKGIQAQYLDPKGNLYSKLYSTAAQSRYTVNNDPTSGYNAWKTNKVTTDALNKETKAESEYTTSDSPFLRDTGNFPNTQAKNQQTTTQMNPAYTNLLANGTPKLPAMQTSGTAAASDAAKKMSDALSAPPGGSSKTGSTYVQSPAQPLTAAAIAQKPASSLSVQAPFSLKPTSSLNSNTIKLPGNNNNPAPVSVNPNPYIQNSQSLTNNNSSSLLTGTGSNNGGGFWGGVKKLFNWL